MIFETVKEAVAITTHAALDEDVETEMARPIAFRRLSKELRALSTTKACSICSVTIACFSGAAPVCTVNGKFS